MNILVVSPHVDDETLGAGGTILKYKEDGHKVYWLNITNVSVAYGYSDQIVKQKMNQIQDVCNEYQIDGFYDLGLKPAGLEEYGKTKIIDRISKIINQIKPNTIFIPYKEDIHSDHKLIFECIYSCSKIFRYPFVKKILCMEILSETDFADSDHGFIPNYFININQYIEKKIEIMKRYKSEVGISPFPRSEEKIRALAAFRGSMAGCHYAEAFRMIKWIED